MKKILLFTSILAALVAFSGCSVVSIPKPNSSQKVTGLWTSRTLQDVKFYNSSVSEVAIAARQALRDRNCKVVYEAGDETRQLEITARGSMDVKVTIDIFARVEKLPKGSTKQPEKYTEVAVVYGAMGDLPLSQEIVEYMLKYLPNEQ